MSSGEALTIGSVDIRFGRRTVEYWDNLKKPLTGLPSIKEEDLTAA